MKSISPQQANSLSFRSHLDICSGCDSCAPVASGKRFCCSSSTGSMSCHFGRSRSRPCAASPSRLNEFAGVPDSDRIPILLGEHVKRRAANGAPSHRAADGGADEPLTVKTYARFSRCFETVPKDGFGSTGFHTVSMNVRSMRLNSAMPPSRIAPMTAKLSARYPRLIVPAPRKATRNASTMGATGLSKASAW